MKLNVTSLNERKKNYKYTDIIVLYYTRNSFLDIHNSVTSRQNRISPFFSPHN